LVTALSRPAVRGQWGEISLRRLVELAGLSNRCDFNLQQNIATEDGRLRPDMVVNLPGDRTVVVDCKVPLDAFLDAASAADQDVRRSHLMRHAQQIRSRAHDLSSKAYWNQFDRAPEFAIMFLPGEAFLYSAIEFDNSLIDDCLKQHIIIATSTLIALLKTIEFGWRQEQITQNAEQIKELGVDLYNRINTVLTHLSKLGASLTGAVKSYNDTVGSVESRVIVTARKFGELGARGSDPIKEPQLIDTLPRTVTSTLLE
jgi:DNA recombination protein RmuC